MVPEKAFVAETTGCLRLEAGGPDCQPRRIFAFRDRDAIGGKVVHPGQMGAVLQICIKQKPIFVRIFFSVKMEVMFLHCLEAEFMETRQENCEIDPGTVATDCSMWSWLHNITNQA